MKIVFRSWVTRDYLTNFYWLFLLVEIQKIIMGVFFLPSPNAIRLKIDQTSNSLRLLKDKFKIKTFKARENKIDQVQLKGVPCYLSVRYPSASQIRKHLRIYPGL